MIKASFVPNSKPLPHLAQFVHVSPGLSGQANLKSFAFAP